MSYTPADWCAVCACQPCTCQRLGRIDLLPGPWECPRCGTINGPQTERCVCKPGDVKLSPGWQGWPDPAGESSE